MTVSVSMYEPHMRRIIPSPMSLLGVGVSDMTLPFAHDYLWPRDSKLSSEAVRVNAIRFHAEFNAWCRTAFGGSESYGSDSDGYYIPEGWDERTRAAYELTVRLLGIWMTASTLGYGLQFSR